MAIGVTQSELSQSFAEAASAVISVPASLVYLTKCLFLFLASGCNVAQFLGDS